MQQHDTNEFLQHDGDIDLNLRRDEVERILAPFITERFTEQDSAWQDRLEQTRAAQRKRKWWRRTIGHLMPWKRRTQIGLKQGYEDYWSQVEWDKIISPTGPATYYGWRNGGFKGSNACIHHVYHLMLMRAIAACAPQRILEVGFGNGHNLLVLAARFPNISFSGVELTNGGVHAARAVAQSAELPEIFGRYAPEPLIERTRSASIAFEQGSALKLAHPDGAFDFVFTVLALEQMEEIRNGALREIARVSSRYVCMIEPFRDWNADGAKRDYIIANDYFSASIADVESFGLRRIYSTGDFPCKLRLGVGFVLFEKTDQVRN